MEIIRYTGTNQSKKWGMAARQKERKLMQWENPKHTSKIDHKTSASSAVPPHSPAAPGSCLVAHEGTSSTERGQCIWSHRWDSCTVSVLLPPHKGG